MEEENKIGAKGASLASMIAAVVWVALLSIAKAIWGTFFPDKGFGLTMNEILLSGVFIAAAFTPVYLNLIMDKIRDIVLGGKSG